MSGPLLVLPGDPRGIGPEVTCRALVDGQLDDVVILGDLDAVRREAAAVGLRVVTVDTLHAATGGVALLAPPPGDEPVEVRAIRVAVDACRRGDAAAMVTGPIHKARLAAQGFGWAGHTDFLAHLCGTTDPVMAFVGGQLKVALVTVHLPLRAVPDALTTPRVLHTLRVAKAALVGDLRLPHPRLLVCGLNPHAGDDGLLGREDLDVVAPAVVAARTEGIDAVGPISAEAAFLRARSGDGDLVVAMYHDQGLAPLKAVDFGRSVNWTLGLPIVRTSVDHGTADDLVGTGRADPASMVAAIAWARELASRR